MRSRLTGIMHRTAVFQDLATYIKKSGSNALANQNAALYRAQTRFDIRAHARA